MDKETFETKLDATLAESRVRRDKAEQLGFGGLTYDMQWVVFNKARMFGWDGTIPGVLGNYTANKALDSALDFLIEQGITFKKEGSK